MSAILQTIIGAAAAIVGGFVGAWWQTRRADDIARRIRRDERREQALLALIPKATDVAHGLANIRSEVDFTPRSQAARAVISEFLELWFGDWSVVIPDPAVQDAAGKFVAVVDPFRQLAPAGWREDQGEHPSQERFYGLTGQVEDRFHILIDAAWASLGVSRPPNKPPPDSPYAAFGQAVRP
jgi:hypothetical protein